MKHFNKVSALVVVLSLMAIPAMAQLSGTYTVGGASPDYSTLSAAISALNSQGVNGPVVFNIRDGSYSGTSWIGTINNFSGASATNTVTIQSQNGDPANCTLSNSGSSSTNYIVQFNGCKYVTVKNLTLNNTGSTYGCDIRIAGAAANNSVEGCKLTGNTSSSTDVTNKSRIYGAALSSSSNISFKSCVFEYGSSAAYLYGSGTTSTGNGYVFEGCEFKENYYYWLYSYYMGDITFKNNTFNRSGSATSYFYGLYMYYTANSLVVENNVFNNTCNASYAYCGYWYYSNYYTQSQTARPYVKNNVFNMTNGTSTTYQYPLYNVYGTYALYEDNTFNITSTYTSGYTYLMYAMYYGQYSRASNNTYNVNRAGGYAYTGMYYGTADTFTNNKINVTACSYAYNYMPYYVQGYYVANNDVKLYATSTAYGSYIYYYTGIWANNKIDAQSSSGTVYGTMIYYQSGSKIYNNIVTWKTSGTSYGMYAYYNYAPSKIFNNTYYSYATGSTNYLEYIYHSSSSYDMTISNNIFARSGTNGYAVYYYNKDYQKSDYNIYSVPGGNYFQCNSPSLTTNSLQSWRTQTGTDMNSLVYNVPFVNAANKDFHINAASPDAWAVNGRGDHDTTAIADFDQVARPGVPADGVPDLGAYEVAPTSTPPYTVATPASPAANSTQVFTFGQDTVMSIDWGSSVPSSYQVRQYTGIQAGPMPAGVGRMYFYVAPTTSDWTYGYKPTVYYKDPWIGDVSSEANAVIARSSNGGTWEGYNYTNCQKDIKANTFSPTNNFDSLGAYTGVENGRIGIRCVTNPTGISITNIKANDADMGWDPVFNPIGYQVLILKELKAPAASDWSAASFASSNSHTAFGLTEDTKYYVYIRSICGLKDTSGYTVDSFVTLITCHTPVIQISSINDNRAVASWQDVKTAIKYEYIISTSSTPPAFGTEIAKTSLLAPYLDPNTQYYVHVRALCNSIYNMSNWGTQPFSTWGLSVGNVQENGSVLSAYPNPATDILTVTLGAPIKGVARIEVLDMAGKVVVSSTANAGSVRVNVSGLAKGVYILKYSDDERSEQLKFNKY